MPYRPACWIVVSLAAACTPKHDATSGDGGARLAPPVVTAMTTRTTVTLAWDAVDGAAGYDIYQDGALVTTSTGLAFTGSGFNCAAPYSYAVDAFDAAGDHTAQVPATGGTDPCLASWDDVVDFFVQDVCLDASGAVVPGVSPIDNNPACVSHRDLRPGELLPYHKTETGDDKLLDEFPVDSGNPAVGVFPMKIKGTLGELDIGDGPANVYLRSAHTIASYSTIDANGPTYHVGSNCTGGVPVLSSLFDTQVRVDTDALTKNSGNSDTYGLRFWKVYNPSPTCPDPDDFTNDTPSPWIFAYYTYPLADGSMSPPLETLVDYGDASDSTHHIEYYYQTREVGRIRFEAWQNIAGADQATQDAYNKQHDQLVASGKCNPLVLAPPPTSEGGDWVEYACGPYAGIAPASDPVNGDSPEPWVDMAKSANMLAPIFGTTPTDNPTITAISPDTIDSGFTGPITITGTGFGNAYFATQNIVMFDGGQPHYVVDSANGATQIVFSIAANDWTDHNTSKALGCGKHTIHVFDGISMSSPTTLKVQNCP